MDHFQSIPREHRAEPFVKWAGGKKKLLPAYDTLLPSHFETYHEPFLGGGAVFLYLAHVGRVGRAILSDVNGELMQLWRVVRDAPERLIAELEGYPYERDFYYGIRALDPNRIDPVRRAARMLYLNRTCFNGLYRVNSLGQFNVPIGRYENPVICNAANLMNVSKLLQGRELQAWSYENVLEVARPGDFVYLDPPHHVVESRTRANQTTAGFTDHHQGKLFEIVRMLDRRGCLVMLSNTSTPLVRRMYRGWDVKEANRRKPARGRRGKPVELVIRNYA